MENKMIMVKSASDYTLVINVPDIPLHRVWKKRGAQYPIARDLLLQAYYDPSVEALFREGSLTTNDVEFLKEVGLIEEDNTPVVTPLTDAMMMRLIKNMPCSEVKQELKKLTRSQLEEVFDFAVEHYSDLQMDRIDLITKATGKDLFKAIEHYKSG